MKREIKFRVWNQKRKIMYSWEDLTHMEVQDMCQSIFAPFDHEIVMQYTGLKDKNGKEIYEGDILIGRFDINEVDDSIYLTLTDEEIETQSKIFVVDSIFYPYEMNGLPDEIEIIGNIYENPELLEDKK